MRATLKRERKTAEEEGLWFGFKFGLDLTIWLKRIRVYKRSVFLLAGL